MRTVSEVLRRVGLVAGLCTLVCGCSGQESHVGLEHLSVSSFGEASVYRQGRDYVLSAPAGREAGIRIELNLFSSLDRPVLVSFALDSASRFNVRVDAGGERHYSNSDIRNYVVLGSGHADSALIYGKDFEPSTLSIMGVSLCTRDDWRCRTEAEFKALLPQDANSETHLLSLLSWASNNVDYASDKQALHKKPLDGYTAKDIYYRYYEPSIEGSYCGGVALFLRRTLESAGYEAITVDYGVPGSDLTHVTTLAVKDGDFYLLDGTFGVYLADLEGKPMSVFRALAGTPYQLIEIDISERDYVLRGENTKGLPDCRQNGPSQICRRPEFSADGFARGYEEELRELSIPVDRTFLLELMRSHFIRVTGGKVEVKEAFIARAAEFIQLR